VENILYIFLDDPQAAKIKETTAAELLDYLINFLIVHEIDGAKLVRNREKERERETKEKEGGIREKSKKFILFELIITFSAP